MTHDTEHTQFRADLRHLYDVANIILENLHHRHTNSDMIRAWLATQP